SFGIWVQKSLLTCNPTEVHRMHRERPLFEPMAISLLRTESNHFSIFKNYVIQSRRPPQHICHSLVRESLLTRSSVGSARHRFAEQTDHLCPTHADLHEIHVRCCAIHGRLATSKRKT